MTKRTLERIETIEKVVRWIRDGWGANCLTKDTDDFPELKENRDARCESCVAREAIEFLEKYVESLREYGV